MLDDDRCVVSHLVVNLDGIAEIRGEMGNH